MPARNNRFRALNQDFRHTLDKNHAWPPLKALVFKLRSKGGGRKADFVDMKAGGTVPEKHILSLIEILRERELLYDFLCSSGFNDATRLSVADLAEIVSGPVLTHAAPATGNEDWHIKGIDGLASLFTDFVWRKLIRPKTLCEDEGDVRTAISMMMSSIGREVASDLDMTDRDAIVVAEKHMRRSFDDFLKQAIERWRVARWSIAFAVVNNQRVACSYLLPLQKQAYEHLRAGERDVHACIASDLACPSTTFFLEAVGHRPDTEFASMSRKSAQALRTIFLQLAIMSMNADSESEDWLRILSMAGHRTSEKRLRGSGFRPTGTKMPGFNIGFMEMDGRKAWLIPMIVRKLQIRLIKSGERMS